jgi:hypothetical protein
MALKLEDYLDRHPSTVHMVKMLLPNPNLKDKYLYIPQACAELAEDLLDDLPDGPELTAGLRKLLEAKDCFVRALVNADPEVDYRDR